MKFKDKQQKFMESIGIKVDFKNLSDEDIVLIEEKVADELEIKGLDEEYNANEVGKMCESILDMMND